MNRAAIPAPERGRKMIPVIREFGTLLNDRAAIRVADRWAADLPLAVDDVRSVARGFSTMVDAFDRRDRSQLISAIRALTHITKGGV